MHIHMYIYTFHNNMYIALKMCSLYAKFFFNASLDYSVVCTHLPYMALEYQVTCTIPNLTI